MSLGVIFGVAACSLFGVVPVYYKLLDATPAIQIALHRFTWTFPFAFMLVVGMGQTRAFMAQALTRSNLFLYSASALEIACSTVLLIWAVNAGYILEVSLGAFLNPITLVAIGVVVLKETLRRWQVVAVGLAGIGVGVFAVAYGKLPWVALLLTLGDGIYSFLKKTAPLTPLHGLTLEAGLLFPFCVAGVVALEWQGEGVLGHGNLQTDALLVGTGVMTIVPLLLLVAATQLSPLCVMGLVSNITPTIQFCIGVFIYHEPFSTTTLVGFSFMWLSMAVFYLDCRWHDTKQIDCDAHDTVATTVTLLEMTTPQSAVYSMDTRGSDRSSKVETIA